ncbi:Plant intracellular Ras-group- LRR protein 4 [Dionaea muscipula]
MATAGKKAVDGVVDEIMQLHRSLPPRPGIEEVEAARMVIRNVEREDQLKLEAIAKQTKAQGVPDELFYILQQMKRMLVQFQSAEEKSEALKLLDLEDAHLAFDDLIQRASQCVSDGGSNSYHPSPPTYRPPESLAAVNSGGDFHPAAGRPTSFYLEKEPVAMKSSQLYARDDGFVKSKSPQRFSMDDTFVKKPISALHVDRLGGTGGGGSHGVVASAFPAAPQILDTTLKPATVSAQSGEKLSLMKIASLIEVSSKKGTQDLILRARLIDQVEWLPDSIGKLLGLVTLDLSENRLVTLPSTIGGLSSLTKLDLHSNRIVELPESIGDLLNLVYLDLSGNQLSRLPPSIGRLVHMENLNLSSNQLASLPDTIGSLVSLKKLDMETNNIEELPHTIGQCTALKEIFVDYNRLKALPEALGKMESLEVLSLRYNNVRQLPTTMASLVKLRELNLSFNELESVPESLCFATSLVKLNIGNNFANLRYLPRSIGNLENLEELDISNNQIHTLPDSFRLLTQLRVLRADQNPFEVPPRQIAEKGAQAVVQYMADLVANRDAKVQPVKQKKSWAQICCFSKSNKRKRNAADYIKT